eukprot:TRINITY_DN9341_c0_g1_i3.p2 TRINITY_DN9341_c0_g1~~TRINITY_DN9341_c0_g1_i3.p2  ORF type:complete len:101 (+),score=1.85 TRINITY_DN9341_c0_g1_i3:410-712(+)
MRSLDPHPPCFLSLLAMPSSSKFVSTRSSCNMFVVEPFKKLDDRRVRRRLRIPSRYIPVSYTHLRAHETPEHLVCRLLLEKKKKQNKNTKIKKNSYKTDR